MILSRLSEVLLHHDFRTLELEFRLGVCVDGKFYANVPKHRWQRMKDGMKGEPKEFTTIDKYVRTNDPAISSRFVSSSTGEEDYWEQKQKMYSEIKRDKEFAIRTSIALEEKKIPEDHVLAPGNSLKFITRRKKVRSTFVQGHWNIDFTRVEQVPSFDDVEEMYEIEIELSDNGVFFEKEMSVVIEEGIQLARYLVSL